MKPNTKNLKKGNGGKYGNNKKQPLTTKFFLPDRDRQFGTKCHYKTQH